MLYDYFKIYFFFLFHKTMFQLGWSITLTILLEKLFPAAFNSTITISQLAFWILLTCQNSLYLSILRLYLLQGLQSRQRLFSGPVQNTFLLLFLG